MRVFRSKMGKKGYNQGMEIEQIRLVEELAANAWRPEIEQHLGGWRLRYSGGSSRRVNSVWASHLPGDLPLDTCLELVEDFYRRRNAVPCYQLCPATLPEELRGALLARGYVEWAHTFVRVQTIPDLLAKTNAPSVEVETSATLTDAWFETYTGVSGYRPESLPIRQGILQRIGPPAHFVLLRQNGLPVATGLGVVERGWLGVFCVVTDPEQRRQGLASAVMNALGEWGGAQGAAQVYLQVMEDNQPALRLYDKLGFQFLYQYFYSTNRSQDSG